MKCIHANHRAIDEHNESRVRQALPPTLKSAQRKERCMCHQGEVLISLPRQGLCLHVYHDLGLALAGHGRALGEA